MEIPVLSVKIVDDALTLNVCLFWKWLVIAFKIF